ncbi:MAG: SPOR domain-containing protein [Thermodesulfobacteriota bacterium]|nr:SPOR domain-containing protein [Thermodesulfobacteriota bacterium]
MGKKEKASPKKKKSSTQWTLKGVTLWICLTFFACAWMFVLGIFVGRGTVPVRFDIEKLENELAALKEAVIKKEFDRYKLDSASADNKTQMEFYDALKNTGEEESLKEDIPQNKPTPLPKKAVSKTKKTLVSKKTATTRKEKPVISITPVKDNKNFTIQVAALKDLKVADNLVAKLKKRGYPAYRSIGKIPGKGIFYRIRIGYFKNRAEASVTFNRLKKEKIKSIIVQR